jgi:hypothetical protein
MRAQNERRPQEPPLPLHSATHQKHAGGRPLSPPFRSVAFRLRDRRETGELARAAGPSQARQSHSQPHLTVPHPPHRQIAVCFACARRPCFAPGVSLPYAQNPAPAFHATPRAGSRHCAQGRNTWPPDTPPQTPGGLVPLNRRPGSHTLKRRTGWVFAGRRLRLQKRSRPLRPKRFS